MGIAKGVWRPCLAQKLQEEVLGTRGESEGRCPLWGLGDGGPSGSAESGRRWVIVRLGAGGAVQKELKALSQKKRGR